VLDFGGDSLNFTPIRRVNGIDGYLSADKTSEWRTMTEAARELNVTNHTIRRLIKEQILPARQLVQGASRSSCQTCRARRFRSR
jgi:excisionase family DNA binding protein